MADIGGFAKNDLRVFKSECVCMTGTSLRDLFIFSPCRAIVCIFRIFLDTFDFVLNFDFVLDLDFDLDFDFDLNFDFDFNIFFGILIQ
jgi:hypothetical protein